LAARLVREDLKVEGAHPKISAELCTSRRLGARQLSDRGRGRE
jgi:hypothetical protein